MARLVWGLISHTHTHTIFHSRHCVTSSLWIPSTFSSPLLRSPACQSSGPCETVKWDWPDADKGGIDWQASTEECVQCVGALGGETVDDARQSVSQSVSPWITLLSTRESTTSPSVYLYIWFKLLSAPKSLFSPRSGRNSPAVEWDHSTWLHWNSTFCTDFPQIKRYYLEATLSYLKISSSTPWNFLKHEKCFGIFPRHLNEFAYFQKFLRLKMKLNDFFFFACLTLCLFSLDNTITSSLHRQVSSISSAS